MIDLHVHTNKSDGDLTPTEVIDLAKESGISLLAITDHDTCEGIEEALVKGKEVGVNVIPGIEITAFDEEEIHVLGYNINYKSPVLKVYNAKLYEKLKREEKIIFNTLYKQGINIPKKNTIMGSCINSYYFLNWLVDNGYGNNVRDVYYKYYAKDDILTLHSDRISVKDAINFIKLLGGIPVLAHPCRISWDYDKLESKVKEFQKQGLVGVETFYSTATPEQTERYLEIANKYDLIVTLGSDYHGPITKKAIHIGHGYDDNLVKYQDRYIKILNNISVR